MLAPLCSVSAVPQSALLLVSGVLECWKHLAGRFNIQLTGSQSCYITPTPPAPDHSYILACSPSSAPPFGMISPSLCTVSFTPLSSVSLFEQQGGGLTAPRLCLSISPPADCIWLEWIVFHLEVIAHPLSPSPLHPPSHCLEDWCWSDRWGKHSPC